MLPNAFVTDVEQVALIVRDVDSEGPLKTTLELVHSQEGQEPVAPDCRRPAPPD